MKRLLTAPALAALLLAGCRGSPPATSGKAGPTVAAAGDPRQDVRDILGRDPDLGNCKAAVQSMNALLTRDEGLRPKPLGDAETDLLTREMKLRPEELDELRRPEFTPLDAHYLEECLVLRDAARAIDPGPIGTADRAAVLLAWVGRQVIRVDPPAGQIGLPAPPLYTLRRGQGPAEERAYVFQGLLRQLGLASCLFADREQPNGPLRVWGVGVLGEDGAVFVFDPRRGRPLPGPGGQGVATLAQLRADPDLVKPWRADAADPFTVPAEKLKSAAPLLAPSLSALAPRAGALQKVLGDETSVRLAVDAAALRQGFRAALEAQHLPADGVRFDNDPADQFAPARRLRSFLPPEEGGGDPAPTRLLDLYRLALVPWPALPRMVGELELPGPIGDALRNHFRTRFITLAIDPRESRGSLIRGHYDEAIPKLIEQIDYCKLTDERIRKEPDLEREAAQSCREAVRLEPELSRQRRQSGEDAEYRERIEGFVKQSKVALLVEQAACRAYLPEATYQLALCKHEQAEQLQVQLDHPAGRPPPGRDVVRDAWLSAEDWWDRYQRLGGTGSADRAAEAAALHARAREMTLKLKAP
jgi:hypothetical protein